MRENDLLNLIAARSRDMTSRYPWVLVGPGDDAAVVQLGAETLLLTVDQVVEHRHFRTGTPVELIARKAIARSVSDIAAMGGTPLLGLATALLPGGFSDGPPLFEQMHRWAESFACPLVGGDIASHDGPMVLTTTIIGRPHPSRGPVLRSQARPGDHVYVTGSLGGSFDAATGLGRHLTFEPRVREATFLCDALGDRLGAMMDISDGLGVDSSRLAAQSACRFEIDGTAVPISPDIEGTHAAKSQASPQAGPLSGDLRRALSDGEDYELLFTARGDVPASCPRTGIPITRIGRVVSGAGCAIRVDQQEIDGATLGWHH